MVVSYLSISEPTVSRISGHAVERVADDQSEQSFITDAYSAIAGRVEKTFLATGAVSSWKCIQ